MRILLAVVLIAGCYKDPHFGDCEVACTATCPGDLTCIAGACRAPGMTGACTVQPGGDAATDGEIDAPAGPDTDGDTVPDAVDNCPMKSNRDQNNEDGDVFGDLCDPCPISAAPGADDDTDGDKVGDGCDPNPTTSGDAIQMFEGFNGGSKPPLAAELGPGTWTYDATAGTAHVDAPATSDSKLVWPISGQNATITTRAAVQNAGTPASVGATDVASTTAGVACDNMVSSTTSTTLVITDGPSSTFANGSPFAEGAPYVLALTRTGASTWLCKRGDGPAASRQFSDAASKRGVVATQASATFDYVLIVTSP